MSNQPPDFMYYVKECLFHNKLMFVAVTSAAKGMIEHEGFFYGEGKSNLAMGLSEVCHKLQYPNATQEEINRMVEQNMGYDDRDVMNMYVRGMENPPSTRIPCWISDDMEVSFGKHRSYDNKFRELAYFSQTVRPYVGIFIGTMPDLGQIALAWRDLFMFEIKVPFRGYCEIQKIKRWTDFKDPLDPRARLEYHGEQPFPIANKELQDFYIPWRDQRVKEHHKQLIDTFYTDDKEEPKVDESEMTKWAKGMSRKAVAVRRAKAKRLKEYEEADRILNT
jgi:hypothetical protein